MASNMTSGFNDIDMIDNPVVNPIIFNNGDENNKVRGQSIAHSASSYRSLLSSSDKSVEEYVARVQRKSNSMDQDNSAVPTDMSSSQMVDLALPLFYFSFLFSCCFIFLFFYF